MAKIISNNGNDTYWQDTFSFLKMFEQNLSDEYLIFPIIRDNSIRNLIVISPTVGVITLFVRYKENDHTLIEEYNQILLRNFENPLVIDLENLCRLKLRLNYGFIITYDVDESVIPFRTRYDVIFYKDFSQIWSDEYLLEDRLHEMMILDDDIENSETFLKSFTAQLPDIIEEMSFQYPITYCDDILYGTEEQQIKEEKITSREEECMQESKGLESFLYHLEFLGYSNKEYSTGENALYVITHPNKLDFVLKYLENFETILFRFGWRPPERDCDEHLSQILTIINSHNSVSFFTNSHIATDFEIVTQAVLPNNYSKAYFGWFIDFVAENARKLFQQIIDDIPEKNISNIDDLPI